MSTRCNVAVKDGHSTLWFYRHSDGYPSVTAESLKTFLKWRIDGKIRDNVGQAAGWLVLLGAMEYQTLPGNAFPLHGQAEAYSDNKEVREAIDAFSPACWKCGAYEPTTGRSDDAAFVYEVDLVAKEVRCFRTPDRTPFLVINASNIDQPVS